MIGMRRLACERPTCLDLTLPFDFVEYRVEDVMTRLLPSVQEHEGKCGAECKITEKHLSLITCCDSEEGGIDFVDASLAKYPAQLMIVVQC